MKERKHAEVIIAWAKGAEVRSRQPGALQWKDCPDPAFLEDWEYEVKPAEPERVYPKTKMSEAELMAPILKNAHIVVNLVSIADAALRHAIDHGQVVTREEFDRVCKEKDAREVEIVSRINKAYDQGAQVIIRAKA